MADSSPVRYRVHYTGRVQGVGFRATCASIARRHAITGTVRNLPDGRVELVIEGDPNEVQRMLSDVAETMERFIQGVTKDPETPRGMPGFRIEH